MDNMKAAAAKALQGIQGGHGGPFGAAIVQVNGSDKTMISCEHNRVLQTNDPTMHAEIAAIRAACSTLGRFSLHDCEIYSTCMPCPMCLSAIMWAKIPVVYYGASAADAADAGFDDDYMYEFIKSGFKDERKLRFGATDAETQAECKLLFEKWKNKEGRNMY
ncbi:MAG: nucleoside deaminase [Oscillospiraceae bacterium]|nr:nucleoside deaminase [Oscillospiraceae bacterium]